MKTIRCLTISDNICQNHENLQIIIKFKVHRIFDFNTYVLKIKYTIPHSYCNLKKYMA